MATSNWTTNPLGELTINLDSVRVPVKQGDRRRGQYPYYGASGIVDYVDGYLFDGEHLLIAEDGENLRTRQTPIAFMASGRFWVNNHAHIVRGNDRALTRFLCYALSNTDISGYLSGSMMPKLTQSNLNRILVPTPPIAVQGRIADILGKLDDKIELNRRMNETLEAMARRLFRSWFVDFDPVHTKSTLRREHPKLSNADLSRRALPNMAPEIAELFPDSFEDSNLGLIPKGWDAGTVPDAIEINPTRTLPKGTVAPWLEMSSMPTRSARAVAWNHRQFGSGTKFTNGDTLVARITPCLENGKTAFVDFLDDNQVGAGSTEYIILRPKAPLPPVFAYLLARTDEFRQHLITNMTGTSGRQRAPADCLNTYPLVTPPKEIAECFAQATGDLFAQMKTIDEESLALTATRDKSLPRLLSGELEVS